MNLIARYASLVKFEHTIFALPFALISLLVASHGHPPVAVLGWVVVAMVSARSAAMGFNRLVDRRIDAVNPRTSDRDLPTGRVSVSGTVIFIVASCALLVVAAWRLNPLCLLLSPVALVVILGYSTMKRVTPWSHLVLGLGLGIAPVGAWLAVTGRFAAFPLWLAAGVMFWVAGFDTIYGCQDVDFDRKVGLHSLAARFGVPRAMLISRIFHVLAVCFVGGAFMQAEVLGRVSLLGDLVMLGLLAWEQALVDGGDLTHIDKAFFTINSWIGMVLLGVVLMDIYLV